MAFLNHQQLYYLFSSSFKSTATRRLVSCSACCSGQYYGPHDDVIKWKHFPRYWPFVRGIHRWLVNSPHKGQWRVALMFSLICAWINGCINNRKAGDLRRNRAHYDVTLMSFLVQKGWATNTDRWFAHEDIACLKIWYPTWITPAFYFMNTNNKINQIW